jgi:hypothetical protein
MLAVSFQLNLLCRTACLVPARRVRQPEPFSNAVPDDSGSAVDYGGRVPGNDANVWCNQPYEKASIQCITFRASCKRKTGQNIKKMKKIPHCRKNTKKDADGTRFPLEENTFML